MSEDEMCPFCGGAVVVFNLTLGVGSNSSCAGGGCGAVGPKKSTATEAIEAFTNPQIPQWARCCGNCEHGPQWASCDYAPECQGDNRYTENMSRWEPRR